MSDPMIGQVLHRSYRITRVLGEGGMGIVYEAVHVRLRNKRFAIKMLQAKVVKQHDEIFARFRREAEVTTALGHRHIVDVIDFNETAEGAPYMVMELLEGEDLQTRLVRHGPLPPPDVARVASQVASALQAAHDKGIVHRDMKPENIYLLGDRGDPIDVKILDFGISKIKNSKTLLTQDASIFGTPHYMSPEQAKGRVEEIDRATDIFALGAICYQALTGAQPFDGAEIPSVLYAVCHREPPPLSELVAELPPPVERVLRRALAKHKAHRYPRVADFARELELAMDDRDDELGLARDTPAQSSSPRVTLIDATAQAPPAATAVSAPAATGASTTTMTGSTGQHISLDAVPRKRLAPLVGFAAVALASVGIAVAVSTHRSEPHTFDAVPPRPAEPAAVTPASQPAAAAPLAKPAPATKPAGQVRIALDITPAAARVFVGGKRRADNPLTLPADGASRRLRVEAPGYQPHEQRLDTRAIEAPIRITLRRRAASSKPAARRTIPVKRRHKPKGPRRTDEPMIYDDPNL